MIFDKARGKAFRVVVQRIGDVTLLPKLDLLGLMMNVQGFVQVHLGTHGPEHSASFARLMATRPEIVSVWTMTGDADYLLRVYCDDLPSLNRLIHDVLLPHQAVSRVHSQIVMDQLKQDGPLPT